MNVLVPCLVFNTFYKYCTVENMNEKWVYIVYGTAIMIVSIVIGVLLSKLFSKNNYLRKIYTYSFSVANFSFMGNAVVFPAAYDDDTTPGASMALILHVMSIITIPVMFAIFI